MSDYIIFTIDEANYALEVSKIERIDQIPTLTPIPNAHSSIDGIMMYQNHTAKVVNFRKMTNVISHEDQILALFNQVIKDHQAWVETLHKSLEEGSPFALALDPHKCRLGKWLYGYTTHDPEVLAILRRLMPVHARLHETGAELLEQAAQGDRQGALRRYHDEIMGGILLGTMKELNMMLTKAHDISSHSQKLLIYRTDSGFFAIKVDGIKDITVFDDKEIKPYAHSVRVGECLQTRGVVEYKQSLVVVIESVTLPQDEVA
jgi:chemotaxis signal transduction protein